MSTMMNPDHFDAPKLEFSDLPSGMAEKLEVGDMIVAKEGDNETEAHVIEIDAANECVYLSKELPKNAEYAVKETSTGDAAPFDAIKKEAMSKDETTPSKDVLTGPLPKLKDFLIQISIKQGDCNE